MSAETPEEKAAVQLIRQGLADALAEMEADEQPHRPNQPQPRRRRSKRKKLTHHAYSSLQVVCPYGHPLGKVIKSSGQFLVGRSLNVDQDVPEGVRKVRADCGRCHEEGRKPDYQGSWQRVFERLTELDANPLIGVSEYVLGGKRVR